MAGAPQAEAWSGTGALTLVHAAGGVPLWRPVAGAARAATPVQPYGYRPSPASDGRRVPVLETLAVGLSAHAVGLWVSLAGSTTPFRPSLPAGDAVPAVDPGGKDFWYGPDGGRLPIAAGRGGAMRLRPAPPGAPAPRPGGAGRASAGRGVRTSPSTTRRSWR